MKRRMKINVDLIEVHGFAVSTKNTDNIPGKKE